ncbi:MAG: hypothetical protein LUE86_03965 [Clostridiales bacterium]|nr:hypothetical protein [Clostridiales bacterium]
MSEEVKETMDDFARELEASYREFDERRSNSQEQEEGPDAEKWNELTRMMEEKEVVKVQVKDAVKVCLVA